MYTTSKEIIFQLVLHALVFIFYSFERRNPHIEVYKVAFFLNYAFAAFVINYFLLPRYYYQKKQLQFFVFVLIVILGVILVEELVLEQIFFSDNRIYILVTEN